MKARNAVGAQAPRELRKAPCKRTQHIWMLHVVSLCTPCCMLLRVGGSCCAKFETGLTFSYVQTDATTPNNVASICKMPKGTKVSHRCVTIPTAT